MDILMDSNDPGFDGSGDTGMHVLLEHSLNKIGVSIFEYYLDNKSVTHHFAPPRCN